MSGCWLTCGGSPTTMPEVADTCSLASPASVCRTQHLHLRCSVDFARRALTGTAALTVQSQEDNLRSLVRGACAAPLLRGRSTPAPRPCSLRALRSLSLPALHLFLSSHTHPFLSLTFTSALSPSPSTYECLPPLFLDTSLCPSAPLHASPLTHSWDTSSYPHPSPLAYYPQPCGPLLP